MIGGDILFKKLKEKTGDAALKKNKLKNWKTEEAAEKKQVKESKKSVK